MSDWKPKRFWKQAAVAETAEGYAVELDGRPVRTPAKASLILPTRALAQAIAAEWDAQEKEVDPTSMPYTRTANAAIDKVRIQHGEVADMLAAYGDSDLLCYRAESPAELVELQAQTWDPALDWAAGTLGARLLPIQGVMYQPQPSGALDILTRRVHALNPFQLAAFHDLVSLPGSLVLGFAAALNWREADEIWQISRLDETWQEEQWGPDEEARALAALKRVAFLHAKAVYDIST